tara:strand:- start:3817 stop:4059 length:243 start_codon:yes stop_codon:yes gene_type:complete
MRPKILNILVYLILISILVLLFVLINIEENKIVGNQTINGSMEIFNVSQESVDNQATKTSEKYDEKYLEYLDEKQEKKHF